GVVITLSRRLNPSLFPYTTLFRSNSQSYGDGRDRRSNEQPGYRSGRGVYGSGSHGVRGTFVTGKPAGRNDNDTDWGKRDFEASGDRKSTRLNSSHVSISYAVFCLQ